MLVSQRPGPREEVNPWRHAVWHLLLRPPTKLAPSPRSVLLVQQTLPCRGWESAWAARLGRLAGYSVFYQSDGLLVSRDEARLQCRGAHGGASLNTLGYNVSTVCFVGTFWREPRGLEMSRISPRLMPNGVTKHPWI